MTGEKPPEARGKDVASGQIPFGNGSALLAGQVRLLYQQTPSAFLAILVNAALLGYLVKGYVNPTLLGIWLSAVVVLTVVRHRLTVIYKKREPPVGEAARWARRFVIGVALSGCLWGAAGMLFFIESSPMHQMLLAFVLAGMTAGAVSTLSSCRGAYPAFLLPSLMPFAWQIMSQGGEMHLAMGVMVIVYIVMMLTISRRLYNMVSQSLRTGFRNIDLVRELTVARDYQETINQELKSQIAEREDAERLLQRSYEEMEQRVRTRTQELDLSNKILHLEKELFRVTLASIGDAVITTDEIGNVRFLNPVAEQLTGMRASQSVGLPLRQVFRTLDEESREPLEDILHMPSVDVADVDLAEQLILVRADGEEFAIDHTLAPILDGSNMPIGNVLVFRDVSAQRKLAQELSYQATHDELTGLVNRREFERRLTRVLNTVDSGDIHALLYLDLDQFKVVNDQCGHTAGDQLLRQLAALLQAKIRARDTLARLGGDEFGVLLEHCRPDEASRIAQNLRELVQNFRFTWEEKSFAVAVTIGLFPITAKGETLSSALGAADSACYAAKASGRNRVHVFQPGDRELLERQGEMRWLPRIQEALSEDQFCLFFQPIVPFDSRRTDGEHGEILVRLRDEQGKLIMPGAFLPAAERYHQIVAIDRWVVRQCLELLSASRSRSSHGRFAINLSAQALADENFLDYIVDVVTKSGITPSSLCFEIHENAAIADFRRVRRFIAVLRRLGCRFALDDFGAGFSSFCYLKSLSVDFLKIDGRLVRDMLKNPVDQAMVESIHNIGHVMGLKTIAEWVETLELSRELEAIGIDYGQGFHLGKPRMIADFHLPKH